MRRLHRGIIHALVLAGTLALPLSLQAKVSLPSIFASHMVLQRDAPLPVWGWADPGEKVTVSLNGHDASVQADAQGHWQATLPAQKAGGPLQMSVRASNTITYEDVMIGEVWLCSGQSNMEMGVRNCLNAKEEIADAKFPGIRLFDVPKVPAAQPAKDIKANWMICSPETISKGGWGGFSASAYFFGRKLHQELGIAVGLIDSSWGGTRIEPWTCPEGFAATPKLKSIEQQLTLANPKSDAYKQRLGKHLQAMEAWMRSSQEAMKAETLVAPMPSYPGELLPLKSHGNPAALYNAMIHPLVPFAIRGAIWYQGESNRHDGMMYYEKMKALVNGWRQIWGQSALPFYYVQIAPYSYGNDSPEVVAKLWEAQAAALAIPDTGMVVTTDIGNLRDIHPKNKQEVGRRLALWALAKTYGRKDLVHSGPLFKSMSIEGDKIRLRFDHVGSGLASRDGKPLDWFEIIGQKGGFVKATATIDGDSLLLSSPEVAKPAAMRFAWHKNAEPNFMNKEGLPASPFRAGEVPHHDLMVLNVPEAKDYKLVYSLDLAKLGKTITYDQDKRKEIGGAFDRVAYYLELQENGKKPQFVYVSMDAFTEDASKIGIPTAQSKAFFQQKLANMNIYTNVEGLTGGAGLKGGNIEFWPSNYSMPNSAKVPGASDGKYDFGDGGSGTSGGYGSMQVHNYAAKQTVFALNHWIVGSAADLGIGNRPTGNPDWTFAKNAKTYTHKILRVLVRPRQ
jgi:sialate O-acetylesterase